MGWGWGENLRGWGGDGDKPCGDGAGMGKTYLLRGGDGDEIVSPCHSLIQGTGCIHYCNCIKFRFSDDHNGFNSFSTVNICFTPPCSVCGHPYQTRFLYVRLVPFIRSLRNSSTTNYPNQLNGKSSSPLLADTPTCIGFTVVCITSH